MRTATVLALLAMFLAGAGEPAAPQGSGGRQDQIAAASADAVASLRQQVKRVTVTANLSAGELVERVGGERELEQALQQAKQIGGPRWIGDEICQVRLEISGEQVAGALVQMAAEKPDRSPLSPEALRTHLRDLERRTFLATGASIGAPKLESLRPPQASGVWATVPEAASRQAVMTAQSNAIRRVLESIRPIELGPGKTIGDVLAKPAVGERVSEWLKNRPVTRVEFRDDARVEVTLAVAPEDLTEALRSAVEIAGDVPQAGDEQAWEQVRQQMARRMATPVGRGAVPASAATAVVEPAARTAVIGAVRGNRQPPEWAYRQIDTEGTATYTDNGSRLKALRTAEANAMQKLGAEVESLPLPGGRTVGSAAQADPQIREGVKRALARARMYKTYYDPAAGTVMARVSLDLRELWDELGAVR